MGWRARGPAAGNRDRDAQALVWRDAKIDTLSFEVAQLRRLQYGAKSQRLSAEQRALFDEAVDGDVVAIEEQIAVLKATLPPKPYTDEKRTPKRAALPERLPRVDRHHELENTTCGCGCQMSRIGEHVSEKLDYTPWRVHRRTPRARQVGLCALPHAGAGARAGGNH